MFTVVTIGDSVVVQLYYCVDVEQHADSFSLERKEMRVYFEFDFGD